MRVVSCQMASYAFVSSLGDLVGHADHHHVGCRGGDKIDERQLQTADRVDRESNRAKVRRDGVLVVVRLQDLDDDRHLERKRVGELAAQARPIESQILSELPFQVPEGVEKPEGGKSNSARQKPLETFQQKNRKDEEQRSRQVREGISKSSSPVLFARDHRDFEDRGHQHQQQENADGDQVGRSPRVPHPPGNVG